MKRLNRTLSVLAIVGVMSIPSQQFMLGVVLGEAEVLGVWLGYDGWGDGWGDGSGDMDFK